MIDRAEFGRLVRDALCDLYDYAALETHPLAELLHLPAGQEGSQAERLRNALLRAIEGLRPPTADREPGAAQWRPYLVLHGRYVEGASLSELQNRLSLSERQLRREHARAVIAFSASLWDEHVRSRAPAGVAPPGASEIEDRESRDFDARREPLEVADLVRGVARTLERRMLIEGAELLLAFPEGESLPPALADRVIVRQILLSLLNFALDMRSGGPISTGCEALAGRVVLWVQFDVEDGRSLRSDDAEAALEPVSYWAERLDAGFLVKPPDAAPGLARLSLSLPRADRAVVLVVDDQPTAIRLFGRYLTGSNAQVVGLQDAQETLALARQLQPQAITLDVMMPTVDGWETLQALKADPETHHIPVIICSVWDEPELASSLGADGFLKKPISQRDLVGLLARLQVLDVPTAPRTEEIAALSSTHGAIGAGAA